MSDDGNVKWEDINVGDRFLINKEAYIKTGALTYVSVDNAALGEYSIQPIVANRLKTFKLGK